MAKRTGMSTREFLEAFLDGKTKEFVIKEETLEEKAKAMLNAIQNRNAAKTANKKPSKAYEENAPIRKQVVDFLTGKEDSFRAKDIAEALGLETTKSNGVLRQMIERDNSIERIDNGRNKPLEYRLKEKTEEAEETEEETEVIEPENE